MRHSELLAAISDLEPIEARGSFQQHCPLRWDGFRPSAARGRWGERGAFEVLYLGRPAESVIVEAYRHPYQAVAAAAHQLGLGGILAPAATGLGETSPCSRSTSHTRTGRPSPTARSGTACQPTRVSCAWPTTQARPGRMTPVR